MFILAEMVQMLCPGCSFTMAATYAWHARFEEKGYGPFQKIVDWIYLDKERTNNRLPTSYTTLDVESIPQTQEESTAGSLDNEADIGLATIPQLPLPRNSRPTVTTAGIQEPLDLEIQPEESEVSLIYPGYAVDGTWRE
jgi:hypothetical protein